MNRSLPLSDPRQPRIVQLGAVLDHPDGREAMQLNVILAHNTEDLPPEVINNWAKAQEIHGISPEFSQSVGVNETTAIQMFLDMVEVADTVIGQNIKGFDNILMTGTARRIVQNDSFDPFAGKNIFDTMIVGQAVCKIRFYQGGYKKPNLTELHKFLFNGEGFADAHQAISDVLACRRCFYELQRRLNPEAAKAEETV